MSFTVEFQPIGRRLVAQEPLPSWKPLARQIEYLELTLYPNFEIFYANGIRA